MHNKNYREFIFESNLKRGVSFKEALDIYESSDERDLESEIEYLKSEIEDLRRGIEELYEGSM